MWQDNQAKSVKRSLSVYEKSLIPKDPNFKFGNALIFPGEPNTEVEELVAIGFRHENIFGIERDYARAEILLDYYYDSIRIFCDEMNTFLNRTKNVYNYAHLDYCGHFNVSAAEDIIQLARKTTDYCFIRVTLFDARRAQSQKEFEETFWDQLCYLFESIGSDLTVFNQSWQNKLALYAWFVKSYDDGINSVQDFFNLESLDEKKFKFYAINPYIYTYKEAESTTQMATFFMRLRKASSYLYNDEISDTIEALSQTPAYYLKPEPVGVQ